MKAVLSNRILLSWDEQLYRDLRKKLTYTIPSKEPNGLPEQICTIKKMQGRLISLPIGRTDLIPENAKIIDKRVTKEVEFPKFKYKLRSSQQEIYDKINDSCLINANVSFGKTFTAIAVATKLKQKTLVVVHTLALRDQWIEEIKKTLGIKPGVISSGIFNINSPIVISNIQTLRKHTDVVAKEFGLVIVDECHHVPATTFDKLLNSMKARYKIGLSATLRRKDQKHILIADFIARKVYQPPKENMMLPEVLIIKSGIKFSTNNKIPWAYRVNDLLNNPDYFNLVLSTVENLPKRRKILIVADRTEFLERCHEAHKDSSIIVTGEVKDRKERHKIIEKDPDINKLYGAISIYKEGISLNFLDTLILATPTNNEPLLEQLVGRIQRHYPDKPQPLIIDFHLRGATATRQMQTRVAHYIQHGYPITYAEV